MYFYKEGYKNVDKTYILLGDSILKNNAYVDDGNNIEDLIIERNKNILCYAKDDSKINNVFEQVNQISLDLNNSRTYIFLSIGGNNILFHYVDENNDINDKRILRELFKSYINVIKSIQNRLPKANLILLDIYYPYNIQYHKFHSIIKEWNHLIHEYAENPKNNIYSVIRISNQLTGDEDFSFGIEPSTIGGKKIVDLILNTY
jgi:hypothetical protein